MKFSKSLNVLLHLKTLTISVHGKKINQVFGLFGTKIALKINEALHKNGGDYTDRGISAYQRKKYNFFKGVLTHLIYRNFKIFFIWGKIT